MFCVYELATGTITQVTTVHQSVPAHLPSTLGLYVFTDDEADEWTGRERFLIESCRVDSCRIVRSPPRGC